MNITRHTWYPIVLGLLATLVGLCAITQQSLWMDEGSTAFKALMPTFKDWVAITYRLGGSDIQMPLYMVAVWAWVKIGFISEYALRCINLPFLVLMVLALRRVRFWPLVCLASPFVLYYVGELRPYTLQMAAGALVAAGLARIIESRRTSTFDGLHTVALGCLLLTLSSLTAAVWAAGAVLAVVILRPDWLKTPGFWTRSLPWCLTALIVIAYYIHTLQQGYRAATSGGGGLLSIGFGFYEILGLLGIGPTRNELRATPFSLVSHLAWLIPAFFCLAGAWSAGVRTWLSRTDRGSIIAVTAAVLLPLLTLALVGLTQDFRVLGRHLSPAIPAVLLPIALCLESGTRKVVPNFILATCALIVFLVSSLCLRLQERHARDDYQAATSIAIDALKKGKRVLWQADMNATRYYAYRQGGMRYVHALQQLEADPPGLMFADLVVINRPDLRFKGTDYKEQLRKNGFKIQSSLLGFEIWSNLGLPPSSQDTRIQ
ncbi:hypothetical protein JIN84_02085 [Luteolibacter yonseiensis]|uniref:Uncharacterized protein n=1 Tax=Luteolibacter yonseiensis TaxID=1144680 RepID=A0A934QX73_9BACT|nr:hypothetical protein [Luteolibacter yonseiensis]MBK1814383.1 hypothetical protein [Luteolibacter yonseiensis]